MKKKIIIGMLLVLALFMTACSNKEEKSAEGKVLKVAVSEDTTTLEPTALSDDYEENILIQVYDTLVKRNAKGELVNSLAESIENPDPQTFKIKLRDGVKFLWIFWKKIKTFYSIRTSNKCLAIADI